MESTELLQQSKNTSYSIYYEISYNQLTPKFKSSLLSCAIELHLFNKLLPWQAL